MSFLTDNDTDNYNSSNQVWDNIKDYIPIDKVIWEPFYGDGCSGLYLNKLGFNVIHEDIDFFDNDLGDILVSNPPFSKRKDIFERLLLLDKPFIMIMFPSVFSCKWFLELFGNTIQLIIPKKRPTFYHIDKKVNKYTPRGGTWYFCYKMNLPKDINNI